MSGAGECRDQYDSILDDQQPVAEHSALPSEMSEGYHKTRHLTRIQLVNEREELIVALREARSVIYSVNYAQSWDVELNKIDAVLERVEGK